MVRRLRTGVGMGMGTGSATGIGAGAASTALADRRPPRVNENLMMKILRLDSFVTFRVRRPLPGG